LKEAAKPHEKPNEARSDCLGCGVISEIGGLEKKP